MHPNDPPDLTDEDLELEEDLALTHMENAEENREYNRSARADEDAQYV